MSTPNYDAHDVPDILPLRAGRARIQLNLTKVQKRQIGRALAIVDIDFREIAIDTDDVVIVLPERETRTKGVQGEQLPLCPGCGQPAHASESDDENYHAGCRPSEELA